MSFEEEWRDIKDFEGLYQVSNYGRVKSCDRIIEKKYKNGLITKSKVKGKLLSFYINNKGYLMVRLYYNGKSNHKLIHRLVAEVFIPNPEQKPEVNHKDEFKHNNVIYNLEWCTRTYNNNYGKQSKNERRKSAHHIMKKVCQFNLEGKLVNIFDGLRVAEEKTRVNHRNISKCCNGKVKIAGGYKWAFFKDGGVCK